MKVASSLNNVNGPIEEISQSGLVDIGWYNESYPDIKSQNIDPIYHYYHYGWKEGRNPNAYFDTNWFISFYDLSSSTCPLLFYISNWKSLCLIPSNKFDPEYYLEKNKDIANLEIEPVSHYLYFGKAEGRLSKGFSTLFLNKVKEYKNTGLFLSDWYGMTHEDLRDTGVNYLFHFIAYGEQEFRNPNPYFDTKWYLSKYSENIKEEESPLLHYANKGWKLGFNPSPKFSVKKYIEKNLAKDDIEPLSHFIRYGKKMGLSAEPVEDKAKASKGGKLTVNKNAKLVMDPSLRGMIDNTHVDLSPLNKVYSEKLDIHFVMPDFSPGAGGHMTIFRMIRYLEIFGHKLTIWIYSPTRHKDENAAYQEIVQHFQLIKADVKFTSNPDFKTTSGDIVFATDWGSVSFVSSLKDFKRRFYFVQDHEPQFYATGSHSLIAERTYQYDLDCICASPWLKEKMQNTYHRWAEDFWLAVDFDIYYPPKERASSDIVKMAFYARHFTSRRAVELGLLALESLARKNLNIEVHCFGAELPFSSAPFKCIDHGIRSPEYLANLYRNCDIGIVFSATNYSLIPQEMMACGLSVAELDTESTRAIFPNETVTLLSPDPSEMAAELDILIHDKTLREFKAKNGQQWVSQFDWESAAKKIEKDIFKRLDELGFEKIELEENVSIKASIVIPTWNAGKVFEKVIKKLLSQIAPWKYEIVVVDSGSVDGTVEFLKEQSQIKLLEIPNSQFQHGRTRNFAIQHSSGEFVAVITQDALPVDDYWLYNLVASLEHYPNAAGVFGKHYAWPDADPFTKRDLVSHFEQFENQPYCVSKNTNPIAWKNKDTAWQQFLHFYSDNNSMMRRSIWEKIPYPEIPFGEDQAWAFEIIKAGYEKVYSKQGAVFHSHDFDEGDVEKRAYEEAIFFKEVFGYTLLRSGDLERTINSINVADKSWSESNNVSADILERRMKSNSAKLKGFSKVDSGG